MNLEVILTLRQLSDDELVAQIRSLVARERHFTAHLVAHLAELDTRDIHLREGYGSLFAYCRDGLGLSEHEAYNRIEVARGARRFPVILEMLDSGGLSLTAVRLLAPHLTASNHRQVLESARGKRKIEVEPFVAALAPRPDVASSVRRLPAPRSRPLPLIPPSPTAQQRPLSEPPTLVPIHGGYEHSPQRGRPAVTPRVAPLSPDRYKLQVTISGETLEKLRRAKDLLRHAIPSGDEATLLDRALTALLADLGKRKFAKTDWPRSSPTAGSDAAFGSAAKDSRHVPAAVKRAVWTRDRGQCAFTATNGRRCGERSLLEFHHVRPYAVGGEATALNIQMRCRRHNQFEAKTYFVHRQVVPERVGVDCGVIRDGPAP